MNKPLTHTALNLPNILLFCILFVLSFSACKEPASKGSISNQKEKRMVPPQSTLLSELAENNRPHVTLLDTAPAPQVINLPAYKLMNSTVADSNKILITNNPLTKTALHDAKGLGFFSTLTTDDGLSLDQVYCSFKDKWGNLWFGTNGGGVSRYDGKNFTTYTTAHGLANNVVWCIMQDHADNIWFGTDGSGVSKYDGENFTTYTKKDGLADDVVFSILQDKQKNIWFGTLKGGACKYDGKTFTTYLNNDSVSYKAVKTMLEDSKGNIWFGTLGAGVKKWDGRHFSNYTISEGLIGNRIFSMAEDGSGNIWFGADGKGVSKFNGSSFTNYTLFESPYQDAVLSMIKDKQGHMWMGTQNSGVINYNGASFTRYTTANGLSNNQIRAISEDENSNLWLGSFGGGVSKFSGNSFTNFTAAQGLPANVVFSIEEDDRNNLWLGTSGGGVGRYDGNSFTNFTTAHGLTRNEVYSVLKDRAGNLWFGTSGSGVSKFNGQSFTNYTTGQGLANNIVFNITEDKAGNLWFATSGGVSKYDGKTFTTFSKLQGLGSNAVFSIKEDKNANLWFGTLGGGVTRFNGKTFTTYTTEQGLADDVVWMINQDRRGNLWFGTQHGLSLMAANESAAMDTAITHPQSLFTTFTTQDGLPNDFVTQVIEGDKDMIYVGTNLGVCELLPVQSKNGKLWSAGRIFNTQHGYPVKDVNAGLNAMYKDSKGIIWIGTGSDKTGLVRFQPNASRTNNNISPHIFIHQLKLNNEAVAWREIAAARTQQQSDTIAGKAAFIEEISIYGKTLTDAERDSVRDRFSDVQFNGVSKWQALPQQLVLPYDFNNVSFNVGVVETGKNFLVNYQYFLDGYDREWSPPTQNTFVSFGNIGEGDYIFKVKAQSPEGIWSAPVSYSFKVLPPWWRTWWMYSLYIIVIVAAVLLFSALRHRRIIKQKEILEHKVTVATKQVREESEKVKTQKKQIEETLQELKATQAQLIQSEKMASLGELTAGIAHEIQNPLNFVNNFSEVNQELLAELKEEADKGNIDDVKAIANDVMENSGKIVQHGNRAGSIIKGMLQHSRTTTGQKELTNINILCDEYLRLAYHGLRAKDKSFNAVFTTQFDESIGTLNIVPQDIGRVVLNLVTNAFYAVNEKQKDQPDGYQPAVSISTKKLNDKVEITVSDNGNGIPQQIIDKIFQPFFTTKPTGQGTGLGLSMSYDIITNGHGGELKVTTTQGELSEFKIILPARSK